MISRRQLAWISMLVALIALLTQSMLVFGSSSPLSMTGDGLPNISEIKLLASDGDVEENFGRAVALDGDVAVIGAYGDENGEYSGSAYIYRFDGSRWQEESKLLASDGAEFDLFGGAVSVSGDVVMVGARGNNDDGIDSGSAYIYRWNGTSWEEETKLLASDASGSDYFGHSVAIRGDIAVVGANYKNDENQNNVGAVYIYRWDGSNWQEESKLLASDGEHNDYFGNFVTISGDLVAVGAPYHDENGSNSGAAYLFRWNGSSWQEEAKLLASDGAAEDQFGNSIGLIGDTVLVGAHRKDGAFEDMGAAYVFQWDGSSWQEEAILVASDATEGDHFGRSVSISGDTAAIGAARDDHDVEDAGSVYLFRREGNSWQEENKLVASDGGEDDYFGTAASMSNDMLLVGSPLDDDHAAGRNAGSAYLYNLAAGDVPDISFLPASLLAVVPQDGTITETLTIGNSGTVPLSWQVSEELSWVTVEPLSGTLSASESVSLTVSFDSVGLAAGFYDSPLTITSNDPDEQEAEVRLLLKVRQLTSQVKLIPDTDSYSNFGQAVAVSGDVAVVGEWNDAYVYRWNGVSWQQEEQLVANDGNDNKHFGESVSISNDVIIVGAYGDDDNALSAGAAYIFRWNGTSWQQEAKLFASDGGEGDQFGYSVGVNGDVAVVGMSRSTGSAYIYRWNGTSWQEEAKLVASDDTSGDYFGFSVSVSGDVAVIGARNDHEAGADAGSAYVFRWNGTTWQEESKLLPSIPSEFSHFGRSVSISGELIVVGRVSGDTISATSGAAVVYRWDGMAWQEEAILTTPDGAIFDGFGYAVAISGERLIVGAFADNENGVQLGAAYLFGWNGEQWYEQAKLIADDGTDESDFGTSVAIDGERALVGGLWHEELLVGRYAGGAYLYDFSLGHAADIFVAPTAMRQTALQGQTTTNTLRIGNAGTEALTWESEGESWLSTIPTEGTIAPHEALSLTLEFDATALALGTYTGTLTITSNDPDESVSEIRILLRVVPAVTEFAGDDGAAADYFGNTLSISGNLALVGVPRDDDNGSDSGAAYLYRWNGSGWQEESKWLASDGVSGDRFGTSVSLNGDVAIIGADGANGNSSSSGVAYIYRLHGSDWQEEAKLIASTGGNYDHVGLAVSISNDIALVRSDSQTYLFRRDTSGWQEEALLPGGAADNQSIAISADMVFIGRTGSGINGDASGAVLVYRWNGYSWIREATLLASDGEQWERFGNSLSVNGDLAIIGARQANDHGPYSGAAYIYRWDGETWQEESKLTARDPDAYQLFGQSVSISGNIAIVGAYFDEDNGDEAGAAYLFKWNGETWQEKAKLLAVDGGEFDHFGQAVSVSGHFALVGSPGDEDSQGYAGAAYLYDLSLLEPSALVPIPERLSLGLTMGTTAAQPLMIANQGTDSWDWEVDWDAPWLAVNSTAGSIAAGEAASLNVTLDASTLTPGTYSDTLTVNSNQPNSSNIAMPIEVKVFPQITELKVQADEAAPSDEFGQALQLSDDVAIMGANEKAYLFRLLDGTWQQEDKIIANDVSGNQFAASVSISGDVALVGAPADETNGESAGAAYIFRWNGAAWQQEAKLLASDGAEGDYFGYAVSVSDNVALIGAYGNDEGDSDAGAAYIFRWNGQTWQEEQKLLASDTFSYKEFGKSVALHGDLAVVGAYGGFWPPPPPDGVYVYRWNGTSWLEEAKLLPSDEQSAQFGYSVAVSDQWVLVGAGSESAQFTGSAYLFAWDGTAWQEEVKLSVGTYNNFASSVSLSGDTALIGAKAVDDNGDFAGAAYLFRWSGQNWLQEAKLTASDGAEGDELGSAVSVSGDTILIGAPKKDNNIAGSDVGAAYLYQFASESVPDITVSPSNMQYALMEGNLTDTLTIENNGTQPLSWVISSDAEWLNVMPTEGSLAANEGQSLLIDIKASALPDGTYEGTLTITSNDPDESLLNVDVLLTVGSPMPTATPTVTATSSPMATVTATSSPTSTMTPTVIATVSSLKQDIYLPLIRR